MFNQGTIVKPVKRSYLDHLQNVRNLPSIPIVILEVQSMLDNPMTNAYDLAAIISKDQGMVAKILAVANSSLYGLPRRVSTIEFAIVVLGFENVKNIVIALSMHEALSNKPDKFWNKKSYWNHSLATAIVAKRIAEELGYSKSGEAFTAALLHDLGISIIQRYFNDEFKTICNLVNEKQISYLEAEYDVLKISHQEIGNYLCEKWNLPDILSETILNHHNPGGSNKSKNLTSIVHLADFMTQKFRLGMFNWDDGLQLDLSIINTLKLGNEEYLNEFIESYRELFNNNLETQIR